MFKNVTAKSVAFFHSLYIMQYSSSVLKSAAKSQARHVFYRNTGEE